ncbi:MAG: CocE/NonD family hydrolase [Planctomycetota bacterium]|nr:CocE/NonD family hydrolase [Planctomycetota bacterium]
MNRLAVILLTASSCYLQAHADETQAVSVEKSVKIPMRDGVNLGATLYKPKEMPKPLPVIFCLTPYGADFQAWRGRWYAKRGYLVATVDVRGCGHSEGTFKPFENDGRDGHDVVEWLARQPWSNGKVGMFGWSYLGWCQWSTLKEFPPHLETIVPTVSTYPGTEGIPKNRNIFLPYVMSWLNEVNRCSGRPSLDNAVFIEKKFEMYRKHLPFNAFDKLHGETSPAFQTWLRHPAVDPYWDAMNPSVEDYARIDKPILTITGHFDSDQTGAMTHYRRHVRHASPEARKRHYLIIGPWDHAGASDSKTMNAGLTFDKACLIDNLALHKQWYDWTLKDGEKPEFLKKNVAYYVMGAEQWKYADSLEAIPTIPVKLYLGPPGKGATLGTLSKERASLSTSATYTYDPLDTRPGKLEMKEGGEPDSYNIMQTNARSRRYAMSAERFGCGLIYHSDPFLESTELTGYVKLVAWISVDVPDTDFMATLHEITPDGTSIQLTDDALRARYRESRREEKLVTPGEITRYEFKQFWFFSRRIAKGSRLRLVFWSPNSIHLQKNYNSGGVVAEESGKDARTAHITLYHDSNHPSYIEIPVVKPEADKDSREAEPCSIEPYE